MQGDNTLTGETPTGDLQAPVTARDHVQGPDTALVTMVEYAAGHRADAAKVARSLGVAQPQPMEGTVASLSGSAAVVVIVGLDRASSVP